jgi:membrane dipeptidase
MKAFPASLVMLLVFPMLVSQMQPSDADLRVKAERLAQDVIIVDTHIDVPEQLIDKMEDISIRTREGDFDYPRAKAGGLNAPFMSIYVPSSYEEKGGAKAYAERLIAIVEKFAKDWPDKFALARSVDDIRRQFSAGKISLPMGMENGSPIEGKLENVQYFYDRGIRYITLTHAKNNQICDASFDDQRKWNGLSPFGRKVVEEMNRVGIMIDVSHVSDSAFYQVMRITKAPAIASHSSCRYFTPGWERNMDDEMIKLLAKNGGVIQINFGSMFLVDSLRKMYSNRMKEVEAYLQEHNLTSDNQAAKDFRDQYRKQHLMEYADVTDVIRHIDHVVQLVGIDHVGLGSDFDGVGDTLPIGLKDVSYYPNLIYELLKKGYAEDDIQKICSGNLFRVWNKVAQVAHKLQSGTSSSDSHRH